MHIFNSIHSYCHTYHFESWYCLPARWSSDLDCKDQYNGLRRNIYTKHVVPHHVAKLCCSCIFPGIQYVIAGKTYICKLSKQNHNHIYRYQICWFLLETEIETSKFQLPTYMYQHNMELLARWMSGLNCRKRPLGHSIPGSIPTEYTAHPILIQLNFSLVFIPGRRVEDRSWDSTYAPMSWNSAFKGPRSTLPGPAYSSTYIIWMHS